MNALFAIDSWEKFHSTTTIDQKKIFDSRIQHRLRTRYFLLAMLDDILQLSTHLGLPIYINL